MSIHLIVDGYNLIRQSPWLSLLDAQDLEAGREALLQSLVAYRRRRSPPRVTVVFDGWQGGEPKESRDLYRGVGVVYSRRGERADEVIKRLAAREGAGAVVVTSDREIQDFAQRVGAVWVAARHFETRYLGQAQTQGEPEGEEILTPPGRAKKGPARRLSKRLRQKQQRLRKL
jgi:predicted RNA-binding protein with PIN domain